MMTNLVLFFPTEAGWVHHAAGSCAKLNKVPSMLAMRGTHLWRQWAMAMQSALPAVPPVLSTLLQNGSKSPASVSPSTRREQF